MRYILTILILIISCSTGISQRDTITISMDSLETIARTGSADIRKLYCVQDNQDLSSNYQMAHLDVWSCHSTKGNKTYQIAGYIFEEDGFHLHGCAVQYFPESGVVEAVVNFNRGSRCGTSFSFFSNGQLKSLIQYNNGEFDGVYVDYYEAGLVRRSGQMTNGGKEGLWTEYYSNGIIKNSGTYITIPYSDENLNKYRPDELEGTSRLIFLRTGDWIYYDESGNISKRVSYNYP